MQKKTSEIREKIYTDLETYFPAQFTNPLSQSYWRQQKQRILNELEGIIDGVDRTEENEKIDTITRRNMKVKSFMGADNEELKYDKDFEMRCILLAPHSNVDVREVSTKTYFTLIKYADSKNRKK